ncbi:type II toxin-antitoxin system HicB family antitoxin [Desulfosarcina sp. OttesenSCG-928-G10]|nr:type II toxin-antitoxin system HicB family antitoxin [Desulfosarcina sp. OttesenSCG-928-G10]
MYYPATLAPKNDGTGRYDVTFADLPGCVSQGDSLEDALRMAHEALTLHLGSMIEDGDPIPVPSSLEDARAKDAQTQREHGFTYPEGTLYQFILVDARKPVREAAPVRLSISLKPAIVERIDAMANEMGLTRSGLIAVATRDYINRMQM